jgi:crotonobetainyl-CoA:carnitine CoA-transferase CaiB-like acyl-CoA transferase
MEAKGVFSGVRVIELAQYVFVPGASVLLADQGAEVIKVETTGTGDPYRTLRVGDGREVGSVNLMMEQNNRGKKSIALDLKSPEGREALLALVRTADVFMTSLRPKAIRSLGLDVEDLRAHNPKLIYARGNGYGFRGEEADKPGFDSSAFWARGGMGYALTLPGHPLTPSRPAMGDHAGSVGLAFGIASALFKRATTGEPSVVETSLLSTAVWMLSADISYSQTPGYKVHSSGVRFPLMTSYATRDDRLIQLTLLDPRPHWPGLCRLIGCEELANDPRFVDNEARMANSAVLTDIIGKRIAERDWEEWKPVFDAWDAPWELIRTIHDVAVDPQVLANDMIFDLSVEDGTEVRVVAGPVAFDGRAAPATVRPSPGLGDHTDDLLRSVGYSGEAVLALKAKRVAQ